MRGKEAARSIISSSPSSKVTRIRDTWDESSIGRRGETLATSTRDPYMFGDGGKPPLT